MKGHVLRFIVAVALVAGAPLAVAAQDWKGKAQIKGTVVDEQGKAIKDAVIRAVMAGANDGPKEQKSNGKGEFTVKDLKAGAWSLEVVAPKFAGRRLKVDLTEPMATVSVKLTNIEAFQGAIDSGNSLFKEGKTPEARAEFMKVLEASPELSDVHRLIAYTYGRENKFPDAMKHIDLWLDAEKNGGNITAPPNVSIAQLRNDMLMLGADAALKANDYTKMNAYLGDVDDAALGEPAPLLNVAIGLINKDKSDEAAAILNRAQKSYPNSPLPFFYRGILNLRMKNNDAAKPELQKFVQMAGSNPEFANQVKQAQDYLAKLP